MDAQFLGEGPYGVGVGVKGWRQAAGDTPGWTAPWLIPSDGGGEKKFRGRIWGRMVPGSVYEM